VVCHQAVARCLLAYFRNVDDIETELPYMEIPLHTVIKVSLAPSLPPLPHSLPISPISSLAPRIPPHARYRLCPQAAASSNSLLEGLESTPTAPASPARFANLLYSLSFIP
jgi:hypothetical protein